MSRVDELREVWSEASAFVIDDLACGDWCFASDLDRDEQMEFQHEDGHPLNPVFITFNAYGDRCISREYSIDDRMVNEGEIGEGSLIVDYYGSNVRITPLYRQGRAPEPSSEDTLIVRGDRDIELAADKGSAWVGCGAFSVYIKKTDEGVVVDVFGRGKEMHDAIASTYAYESEASRGRKLKMFDG